MIYAKFTDKNTFSFERNIRKTKNYDVKLEPHYHNFFEIYYVEKGSCDYFIDNKAYHLEEGDLVLIPDGIIHNTLYRENNEATRLLINCTRKYIPIPAEVVFSNKCYLYRNADIKEDLHHILEEIENEFSMPDCYSDDIIKSYMSLFFFMMARNKNQYKEEASQMGYIQQAIDHIQKNLGAEISLTDVAGMFSVSLEHFSRKFKKETGFGFCEYVNLLRMKRAETLLKQDETLSIADIAAECGFNDSNYFSVKFKKMYGLSPKALRTMLQKNQESSR